MVTLGALERRPEHFETALALMDEAAAVFDTDQTLWAWIQLEETRARLLAGAAEVFGEPERYLHAAQALAAARSRVSEEEYPVASADFALAEARLRMIAAEQGVGDDERTRAVELAELALGLVDTYGIDGQPRWQEASDEAAVCWRSPKLRSEEASCWRSSVRTGKPWPASPRRQSAGSGRCSSTRAGGVGQQTPPKPAGVAEHRCLGPPWHWPAADSRWPRWHQQAGRHDHGGPQHRRA